MKLRPRVLWVAWLAPFGGLALVSTSAVAAPELDARDYDQYASATENVYSAFAYFRQASASGAEGFSRWESIVRANAVVPLGSRIKLVPVDLSLPMADEVSYGAAPTPHASGLGDLTEMLTVLATVPIDATNHFYAAASGIVTAPVGQYSASQGLNIGANRWAGGARVAGGVHFGPITAEVVGGIEGFAKNDAYLAPEGLPIPSSGTLRESLAYSVSVHLSLDVSPSSYLAVSYYRRSIGARSLNAQPYWSLVETDGLRVGYGITLARTVLVLLEVEDGFRATGQELTTVAGGAASPAATVGRFFGVRVSHAF